MSPRSLPSVFHGTAYVTQSARRNQSESLVQPKLFAQAQKAAFRVPNFSRKTGNCSPVELQQIVQCCKAKSHAGAIPNGNYDERELIMRFSSTNLEPFEAIDVYGISPLSTPNQ